jgi:hypothetical protein
MTNNNFASRIRQFAARLRRDNSGLALTEFALSLPILMTMSVTGVEVASFVNAHMRVSQIALSVADNTGRIRQAITENDIDSAMIGARIAGETIDFAAHGRVILSTIEPNNQSGANAGQTILNQRCFGMKNVASSFGLQGAGATNASLAAGVGPAGNTIKAATGSAVMFVEVQYDYQPIFLVDNSLIDNLGGRTMQFTAAYPVRERYANAIQAGTLPVAKRRTCNVFTAV